MNLRSHNQGALNQHDHDFFGDVKNWKTEKRDASEHLLPTHISSRNKESGTLPTSEELTDTSMFMVLTFADMQKLRPDFSHDIFYVEHPDIFHGAELPRNVFSKVKKVRIDHFTKNMEGMDVLHGNVINDLTDSFTFTSAEVDNPIQNMFYTRIKTWINTSSGGKTRKPRKHRKKKNSRKSAKTRKSRKFRKSRKSKRSRRTKKHRSRRH